MQTKSGPIYQARLSAKFDRKTIGLGSNLIQALYSAQIIDEMIKEFIAENQPVDIGIIKRAVNEIKKPSTQGKDDLLLRIKVVNNDDLTVLWNNYVSFHQSTGAWEDSYFLTTIKTVGNLIAKCPYKELDNKQKITEWIFSDSQRSRKTSKDRLKIIVACVDWNSRQGNIPRHYGIEYRDLLNSIKLNKKSNTKNEDRDVDIFSVDEVYQILEALKLDKFSRFKGRHSQYYKYAYFLWLSGCRPSEAIALKWKNVDLRKKIIIFSEGEVLASGRVIKKQGTKTNARRYFPINQELNRLLESIPQKTGYVFVNLNERPINQQAFSRIWKFILERLNIRHRKSYQLRHTMISYHCNNNFPIHKLAEIVGNSEEVIKNHYLHLDIKKIVLPEIIKQ